VARLLSDVAVYREFDRFYSSVPFELQSLRSRGYQTRGPDRGSRYTRVPPFDFETHYESERWWDGAPCQFDDPWFVQVLENGAEVARVEFDDPGGINPEYSNVPKLGQDR
jgi:hypothetical protein